MISVLDKHSTIPRQELNINKLIDFRWVVLHEFRTNTCENLKTAKVLMTFKVANEYGDYVNHALETSIEEALALKNELANVIAMLN